MYTQLLEVNGNPADALVNGLNDRFILANPEILFDWTYLEAIKDIRRRIFFSQFSRECIYAEPTYFDFALRRNLILFEIMRRQLELYCPLSPEYQVVLLFIGEHHLFFHGFYEHDRFHRGEEMHHEAHQGHHGSHH